jgi:7-cyano-7-deazaguanine synthase in queuosine biosynthesis
MRGHFDRADAVAVLFSGGRDSTLAALTYHRTSKYLHLLSFDSGLGYGGDLRKVRVKELARAFGEHSHTWRLLPNYGLVRAICFSELVDDINKDGDQQILLGESLAMITRAISYCRTNEISTLASGASGYQRHFAEQQPDATDFFRNLCRSYGIDFVTPVLAYSSEQQVKDELLLSGLSGKSLEASTLLSDLERPGSSSAVLPYLERKLPIVHTFLSKNVG